ncbi:MAG TPA: LPXTG cell wall anchor domain-containing protein [Acidimicrobiia bacterium]|nr:LPXTG cell wall anchor domain-containing protein [Acidimicrobiia bacterium]
MNRIRIGLVGLVVASLTGLTAGGAAAATSGRGTASSSITLLSVDLGNVQHLKVLTDQAQGTLDPTRINLSGPQAFASLSAADASGMLNLALPNPPLKATAPGTSNASLAPLAVNFPGTAVSVAGTGLPIADGLLVSGSVNPAKIEASAAENAVSSIVGTSVPSLSVLQGLLGIKGVNVAGVTSNASVNATIGDTGIIGIESVDVLSLAGLLGGLGVGSLGDLSLTQLTGLLDGLGLQAVTGDLGLGSLTGGGVLDILTGPSGLLTTLTGLVGVTNCDDLTSALGLGDITSGLPLLGGLLGNGDLLGGLLGTLPVALPVDGLTGLLSACNVGNFASTLDSVTGTLEGVAGGVLDSLLGTLAGAPLVQLQGVSISAFAKAADTLANSSATTSANFGKILVGGKDLGVLDLNATVEQINALKGSVLGVLNGITGALGLGNLIDIGILERTAAVKAEGSYNVATSGLDLLRLSINPPANLTGIISGIAGGNPLSGLLDTSGLLSSLQLPAVAGLPLGTDVLANAFGLTSLLTAPTTIKVGSINAAADHTTSVAGNTLTGGPADGSLSPGGTLPRTGGTNGAWFAALAAISLAGAFGITRQLRKAPAHQGEDL